MAKRKIMIDDKIHMVDSDVHEHIRKLARTLYMREAQLADFDEERQRNLRIIENLSAVMCNASDSAMQ